MTASAKVSQACVKIMMPGPVTFSSKPENIDLCERQTNQYTSAWNALTFVKVDFCHSHVTNDKKAKKSWQRSQ